MNTQASEPIVPAPLPLPIEASSIDKNGAVPQAPEDQTDDEEIQYNPIPPRRSFTISVQYRFRGRGTPLPYQLDEEEGE